MGVLEQIVKIICGFTPTPGASVTVPLGTGYSKEKDMADKVEKLTKLQQTAIDRFQPHDGFTYCNVGLEYIAHELGCHDLDGRTAACMVQHASELCISKPDEWREDSWERAMAHAAQGKLAFFGIVAPPGEQHGHVASVAARPPEPSGSWGQNVPVLANVGKTNGFLRLSQCFLLSQKPTLKCFLWEPTNS